MVTLLGSLLVVTLGERAQASPLASSGDLTCFDPEPAMSGPLAMEQPWSQTRAAHFTGGDVQSGGPALCVIQPPAIPHPWSRVPWSIAPTALDTEVLLPAPTRSAREIKSLVDELQGQGRIAESLLHLEDLARAAPELGDYI